MAGMPDAPEILDNPFVVEAASDGERLDRFLRQRLPGLSRAALAELIKGRAVRVNGRRASKGQLLHAGDRVETDPLEQEPGVDAELPLRILHEDAWLVAVDKPAGVPSHALRLGERGTIASALLARYPEMATVGHRRLEPGLLHRLDTDTSGVLVAARDAVSFEHLRAAHARAEIDKRYLALCSGRLEPQTARGFLCADQRRVRVQDEASARAKPIETEIVSSETRGEFSLVCVRVPKAARHQVRAHLAALGHPIAADAVYGGAALPGLAHHFLHASDVAFLHPMTQRTLRIHAELPPELAAVLATLPAT
jgi:23S rRNA pseudouridine1911/1915/1917 synthase